MRTSTYIVCGLYAVGDLLIRCVDFMGAPISSEVSSPNVELQCHAGDMLFSRKAPSADASHANKSHELRSILVATQKMSHKLE